MSITSKEIEHLASLARLELTAEEIKQFTLQLGGVLDYVRQVQALSNKSDISLLPEGTEGTAEWRADEIKQLAEAKDLITLASAVENNMVVIPEVFTDKA